MSKEYEWMMQFLKTATDQQLIELFHDLEDPSLIERVEEWVYQYEKALMDIETETYHNELKDADDAQRYRDIKSTQESYK